MSTALTEAEAVSPDMWEGLKRLDRDMQAAAADMPRREATYLVDVYYQQQRVRLCLGGQIKAAERSGEPHKLLDFLFHNAKDLEADCRGCLRYFTERYRVGNWLLSLCGIGHVLAAGLLAHLDIRRAPTAGQFWRFAGLDPSIQWLGKKGAAEVVAEVVPPRAKVTEGHFHQAAKLANRHPDNLRALLKDGTLTRQTLTAALAKRPWSQRMRVLCAGKIGESFVKLKRHPKDFYGHLFDARKKREIAANQAGQFKQQAADALKAKRYSPSTASYEAYTKGLLPGGQIHARARRWVVKLFLSHVHAVMFQDFYGRPAPAPYCFNGAASGHRHLINPPNWPGDFEGRGMRELLG